MVGQRSIGGGFGDGELTKQNLSKYTWPASRLGEAMEAVARRGALTTVTTEAPAPPDWLAFDDADALERWMDAAARSLGIEAEPVESDYADLDHMIRSTGFALLRISDEKEPRFLAILGSRRRTLRVIASDLTENELNIDVVRQTICAEWEQPSIYGINKMLERAGVPSNRRPKARDAILRDHLGALRVGGCWLLKPAPYSSFRRHLFHAGLLRHLIILLGTHTVQYLLFLLAWWILGKAVLQGTLDRNLLWAWALLMIVLIPLKLLGVWSQGRLAIGGGAALKQRLLYGAFRLEPDQIRQQGAGQLLSRVLESEAVESLALSGAFAGITAVVELTLATWVLSIGPGGGLRVAMYGLWLLLSVLLCAWFLRQRRDWTRDRLGMTHNLIERMVGHRTRLAQEVPQHWHDGEDHGLQQYLDRSKSMDRKYAAMQAAVGRGWIAIGLLSVSPAFISGAASPAVIAVALGGILLSSAALAKVMGSLAQLADAAIAWRQVAPLFHAGGKAESAGSSQLAAKQQSTDDQFEKATILDVFDLSFRYRPQGHPVIRDCRLSVNAGDRLLLEGPSGGGKSTLAALLYGLRTPESGLLLLRGLDRQTWGDQGWRRSVVAAPQFHENHVLTGTFAFNLLMGRRWPARSEDLIEAETICRELGLGDVLDRMPAGLHQMLGESGWQLSHGEKSRLYIARALLQDAELVILDESFAALDPSTLRQCLNAVDRHANALLVISHP
ncbi:MAG: ABC transporter ATP-binding protein/permease [Phycisphaerales bacterium]|nr:ABC transporter ATP-binding protein/permease [Phycisphaerales bacterium]